MATLIEFPRSNSKQTANSGRNQKAMATRFVFWRSQEIEQVTEMLKDEFPGADVRNAMNFARVVVNPSEGKEMLTQYVRSSLYSKSQKLAA
ncbi:hypothetical protein BH09VER1_BH09VER1_03540 [soil metagenome]